MYTEIIAFRDSNEGKRNSAKKTRQRLSKTLTPSLEKKEKKHKRTTMGETALIILIVALGFRDKHKRLSEVQNEQLLGTLRLSHLRASVL